MKICDNTHHKYVVGITFGRLIQVYNLLLFSEPHLWLLPRPQQKLIKNTKILSEKLFLVE
jgi:hypothetical protein